MAALKTTAEAIGALYALVGLYVAYLHACKRLARRAEARRTNKLTNTPGGSR